MQASAILSIIPLWVSTYEEYTQVAFLCEATLEESDLDKLGAVLDDFGFRPVPREDVENALQEEVRRETEGQAKLAMGQSDEC